MFAANDYYDNTGDFFHHDSSNIDRYRCRGRRQERLRQQQVQHQRLEDRQQARLEEDQRRQQERGRGDDNDNDDDDDDEYNDDATDGVDLVRGGGGDGRLFRIQTPIVLHSQSRFKPAVDDDDDESESSLSDLDVDLNDSDCESDAEEDAFLASMTSLMSQSFVADAITAALIDDAVAVDDEDEDEDEDEDDDEADDEVRVVEDSSHGEVENADLEDSPS